MSDGVFSFTFIKAFDYGMVEATAISGFVLIIMIKLSGFHVSS